MVTYSETFKDPFLLDPPAWFQSFVLCELLLQFPFFFVATYAFWKGCTEQFIECIPACNGILARCSDFCMYNIYALLHLARSLCYKVGRFICLFLCKQHISQGCGWILMEFSMSLLKNAEQVELVTACVRVNEITPEAVDGSGTFSGSVGQD